MVKTVYKITRIWAGVSFNGPEYDIVQGVFDPNKISGVGTNFGLLVHVLPGPIKGRSLTQRILLS